MKRCLTLFALLALLVLPVFAQQQRGAFNWSLGLQNIRTGELVPFSAPVQSSTGERYRLIMNSAVACYSYIIYESPGGTDVSVLFAGPLKAGETWYSPAMMLEVPRGSESFFIVTSKDEQKTLAQRITAFNNNSGSSQRRALMNEVFKIRSDASKFREAPEKPVLMGGASRGTPEKSQGVEFSGLNTYVKTISIEH